MSGFLKNEVVEFCPARSIDFDTWAALDGQHARVEALRGIGMNLKVQVALVGGTRSGRWEVPAIILKAVKEDEK